MLLGSHFLKSFSNIFVVLDDVQFNRRGWTNRDYIKINLNKELITIPIIKSTREKTMIRDVLIDYSNKRWMDKILNSINQNHRSAQNFKIVFNFLNQTLNKKHQRLIDLNLSIIDFVIEKLNIQVEKIFSSNLNIKSNKSDRIIEICKKLNYSHYITGSGSANYLKTEEFQNKTLKF